MFEKDEIISTKIFTKKRNIINSNFSLENNLNFDFLDKSGKSCIIQFSRWVNIEFRIYYEEKMIHAGLMLSGKFNTDGNVFPYCGIHILPSKIELILSNKIENIWDRIKIGITKQYEYRKFFWQVMLDGKKLKLMLFEDINREFKIKSLQNLDVTNCCFFVRRFLNLFGKGYVDSFDYYLVKIHVSEYHALKLWSAQIYDLFLRSKTSFINGVGSPEFNKEEKNEDIVDLILNVDESAMENNYKLFD